MITVVNRLAVAASAALSALLVVAATAGAQDSSATLRGRITDATSHRGIAMAEVILASDGRTVRSDSAGNYVFADLPLGTVELLVRAGRFPVRRILVELTPGEVLDGSVALDSTKAGGGVQSLPAVTVSSNRVSPRMADFERRLRTGRGQYLTDAQIRKSGADNIQDAVREMRGVLLDCSGTLYGGCRIRMSGAPARCLPQYYVDGQLDDDFGPTTPIRDVVGIEVYTGASDVPGEFAGADAGCGVVVIWTRAGPDRRSSRKSPGE